MLKFAVDGTDLKLVAYQDNAAINGRGLALSPDGKRIAMAGGETGFEDGQEVQLRHCRLRERPTCRQWRGRSRWARTYRRRLPPRAQSRGRGQGKGEVIIFNASRWPRKQRSKRASAVLVTYAAQGTKLVRSGR